MVDTFMRICKKIKNLACNNKNIQSFSAISIVMLLLVYIPCSPVERIDPVELGNLIAPLNWIGEHADIILPAMEQLFLAVFAFLVLSGIFSDGVLKLPEYCGLFDSLAYHCAKLCIVLSLSLAFIFRFTVARESDIIFNIIEHYNPVDVIALLGVLITSAVFISLITDTHHTDNKVPLGMQPREQQSTVNE